jgi:lysozyme
MSTPMTRTQRTAIAAALATALAAPAEGIRQIAYYDPPGILTVCRGHTGPDVIKGKVYSLAECDAFMTDDMRKAVNQVERCQPNLPVPVLAAFADAAFNMGPTVACIRDQSQAARHLASGQYKLACQQLPRWNKARILGVLVELKGLTARRNQEMALCLTGVSA